MSGATQLRVMQKILNSIDVVIAFLPPQILQIRPPSPEAAKIYIPSKYPIYASLRKTRISQAIDFYSALDFITLRHEAAHSAWVAYRQFRPQHVA